MIIKEIIIHNSFSGTGMVDGVSIGWNYGKEDFGKKQTAYHILIHDMEETCVYDSKWVKSSTQNWISCTFDIKSQCAYKINVQIEDSEGTVTTGAQREIITGVKKEEWKAKWISRKTAKPFIAGKQFFLQKEIKKAVISVFGAGQYEAKINGRKIRNTFLDGVWTDYNKRVLYDTCDVTELLIQGQNNITIETGNGWYIGDTSENRHFYTMGTHGYTAYGTYLCCIAQLKVFLKDQAKPVIFYTDASWAVQDSMVTLSNVYGSEDQDGRKRLEDDSWIENISQEHAAVLKEAETPKGELMPAMHPPVIEKKRYMATGYHRISENSYLYDLGQNMSGMFEVCVKGKPGDRIKVTPVEKLTNDGNAHPTVNTFSRYILKGGKPECFCPKFCYASGRWLLIEGACPADQTKNELPVILGVSGRFITSAAKDCGEFHASDQRYDQIIQIIKTAIESNLNHVHTDCPSIEKLGWQEPNHLMGPSIMYLKNVDTLWNKIAGDLRDAQYQVGEKDVDICDPRFVYESGLIPAIAPRYAKFIHAGENTGSFWDIVPWGSSILLAARCQEYFYGNKTVRDENYEAAKDYVDHLWKMYENYSSIYDVKENVHFLCHGLGDWGIRQNEGESRENIETAFLYYDLSVLYEWANESGKPEAEKYKRYMIQLVEEYNSLLLKYNIKTQNWFYDAYDTQEQKITQANQAIPLIFGMVPDHQLESVRNSFRMAIKEGRLASGEIGLRFIFQEAAECGMQDYVHQMIMQDSHPSYYRFIEKGETTLPEFWRDDARSRNHDMMGQIVEWFFCCVAGIQSQDGFSHILIKPQLPEELTWVQCKYKAITGEIEVFYKKDKDGEQLIVETPPNTEAKIYLPKKEQCRWFVNEMEFNDDFYFAQAGGHLHFILR